MVLTVRGATLIELLIALVLAAFAVAGTLGALAHVQRAWRDADRLARMHERAQYIFGTLEPELQMAGYFGSRARAELGAPVPGAVEASCGSGVILPLQPAVRVMQSWVLACAPQGSGARPGSDVLILRRASTRITPSDGALQLLGGADEPGHRNLIVRIFYVARAADGDSGTPALRVKSLSAISGTPSFIDTEVMSGVQDLQVELLPDSVSPRSVVVRVQIRADAADVPAGQAPPELTVERRFGLRNGTS